MIEQPLSLSNGQGGSALVAEANAPVRQAAVEILRNMGWRVLEASHGGQAWRMLQDAGVDLVLAGWNMPEISGTGLLRVIRSHNGLQETPVILIAESITKDQVLTAGRAGVSDICVLPLSAKSLTEKINRLIQKGDDPEKSAAQEAFQNGLTNMESGDYEQALASFKQVLSTYRSAEVYYNMGYIKTSQGKYDEALFYFRKATEINQAFARAYKQMAECYKKLGKPELAQQCLEKAAAIYMEREEDQVAEETLKQVLELNPNTINVYNSLGILYRRQGKRKKAAEQYQRALKVNPQDENIHFNLARLYFETDQMELAQKTLRQALEIAPSFNEARELLKIVQQRIQGS